MYCEFSMILLTLLLFLYLFIIPVMSYDNGDNNVIVNLLSIS